MLFEKVRRISELEIQNEEEDQFCESPPKVNCIESTSNYAAASAPSDPQTLAFSSTHIEQSPIDVSKRYFGSSLVRKMTSSIKNKFNSLVNKSSKIPPIQSKSASKSVSCLKTLNQSKKASMLAPATLPAPSQFENSNQSNQAQQHNGMRRSSSAINVNTNFTRNNCLFLQSQELIVIVTCDHTTFFNVL